MEGDVIHTLVNKSNPCKCYVNYSGSDEFTLLQCNVVKKQTKRVTLFRRFVVFDVCCMHLYDIVKQLVMVLVSTRTDTSPLATSACEIAFGRE